MSATEPPVTLKDQCSIIYDDVLYIYSPNDFLTLPLKDGGKWQKEVNGVSVTGATCVRGGIDGDSSRPALYVVGGTANATSQNYTGIQRYSIWEKSWTTITPVVPITQNRLNHGAAYMNASSAIVIYGGSQNGYTGPSSETFLMEMYPPYRVQAYSAKAPPSVKPLMFSWNEHQALLVGGTPTNQNMFTFGPAEGWQDLGLALPLPIPDPSIAQGAIFTLGDNSRILSIFNLGQSPATVTTYVLNNPGYQPAVFGQTVGGSITTAGAPASSAATHQKREIYLYNYPTYNATNGPETTRTGYSLAQGNGGLVAFVGGDDNNTVSFYNQQSNGWIQANQLLGSQPQNPLVPISTSTPTPTSSATSTVSATATSTISSTPTPSGQGKTNDLTLLGGVLGGICGLAAILLVLLLWLRSTRKRKRRESRKKSNYPADSRRDMEFTYEEGMQPLSRAAQPMGRSPVASAVIINGGTSSDVYTSHTTDRNQSRRPSDEIGQRLKLDPQIGSGHTFGKDLFKRDKSPLLISKPMLPDLGDYKDRPSIELGKATPAPPPVAAVGPTPLRQKSQRKTDEGWAKYFTGDRSNRNASGESATAVSQPKVSNAFVGAAKQEPAVVSRKPLMRDSNGAALQQPTVVTASPNYKLGHPSRKSDKPSYGQGLPQRISRTASIGSDSTDDYEDEHLDPVFHSGVPSGVHQAAWTPVGNTWSGPPQRPLRPPSLNLDGYESQSPRQSNDEAIPNFPMPSTTIRTVKPSGIGPGPDTIQAPPTAYTYSPRLQPPFSDGREGLQTTNDMSWLNLSASSQSQSQSR